MSKKLTHANSLRRKCFAKSNLLLPDSCNESSGANQDPSTPKTPEDHTPAALITVENADNSNPQLSPKPRRKHASNTLSSLTPQSPTHGQLSRSISGSSVDSGVGLSRASSSSSLLSSSKRPSRASSNAVDTASPLLESQRSLSVNTPGAERPSIIDHDVPVICSRSPPSDSGITDEPTRLLDSQSEGILCYNTSTAEGDIDDLTLHTHRLSISRGIEDLQTAVQRLLDDLEQQNHDQTEQIQKQGYLNADFETDGPYCPKRRHSSAGPYVPLTQRLSREVERKRSAQPFFHWSTEDSSSTPRGRKTSACIMCERKHRETAMSAESIIVKTTRFPDRKKQRRYSEVLKVCAPNDIPYTEVRLMSIEELRQKVTDTPSHQQLPRRHARSLPRTLFQSCPSQLKLPDEVRDEQLQFILEKNMPDFVQCTNWTVLYSHLVSKQLLSSECREILVCPLRTSVYKGNFFYGQILPRMGRESKAFIKLYQCFEETRTDHLGHGALLDIIDKGLHRYFYDKYINNIMHALS